MTLPSAAWRGHAGLGELIAALGEARFVGGVVRDWLLGLAPADIDLATPLSPTEVLDRLGEARIKAVPTGLAHGTVTAIIAAGPVEVTTLRRDVATDGRHATVAFTDNWRDDAARRDFTINALYADPADGAIHDYFGGLADLGARRVRFIGDPLQRIAEDHLRILRFFRFLARFGDAPDTTGLAACTARANDLMALSRERIRDELLKLLVARDAVRVVGLMLDHGILKPVLPEIRSAAPLAALCRREADADVAPDALRRLAALLPPATVETVALRLKLSNEQRKRMVAAVDPPGTAAWPELGYRSGVAGATDRLLLSDRPITDVRALARWARPSFPMRGGSLVERGLRKGPQVARVLRGIEERWIAEGFPDADRVAAIADTAVAQALRDDNSANAASRSTGRE